MTEERIEKLEKTVGKIDTRTEKILKLLEDDDFGRPGLVSDFSHVKKDYYVTKREHERRIDRIYWTASGIAVVVSLIIAFLRDVI